MTEPLSVWFYIFLILSPVCTVLGLRMTEKAMRLPIEVFLVSYLVTTVIGATVAGLLHGNYIWQMIADPTMDIRYIQDTNSFLYWFLLFSPFLIVPTLAPLVTRAIPTSFFKKQIQRFDMDIDPLSYVAVLLVMVMFCEYKLFSTGFQGSLFRAVAAVGDFKTLIIMRTQMSGALGLIFFGIVYIGLPTLCAAGMYQWLTTNKRSWLGLMAVGIGADTLLLLSTAQKAPLMIFFGGLFLGYITLRRVRIWLVVTAGFSSLTLLSLLQLALGGTGAFLENFRLILFRVASCYPYYVNVYPRLEPFEGTAYGYGLLGLDTKPINDNAVIFNYMAPSIRWVQGAATSAANVRAYARGGLESAVIILIVVAITLAIMGKFRPAISGPLSFAFYVQGLVYAYFLSQTSFFDSVVAGYGIIFAVATIIGLWVTRTMILLATERVRAEAALT